MSPNTMAATSNSTPQPQPESKSAKKKKAKSEAAKQIIAVPEAEAATPAAPVEPTANGADTTYESPYLKELNKSIRSIRKKLNATQKVDSIIAENPDLSLDELLAQRMINIDQKAQAQKKPSLQASLAQQEEQIAQYKQFDEDYQKRIIVEKSALEAVHREELERVKAVTTAEALEEGKKQSNESLLVLSKFLRAAAAKRQNGDEYSSENRAFEGALLLVYGGEIGAVEAMEKLISGSDEKVSATDGKLSELTFKEVKEASFAYIPPISAEEAWAEDVAQAEPETEPEPEPEPEPASTENPSTPVGTDPTVAHAGLTEIDAEQEPVPEEPSQPVDTPTVPAAATVDTSAANAVAESNWDAKLATSESNPEGWVEVARDPAETDTGVAATPAGPGNTQSWAEDVPVEQTPPVAESAIIPPVAPTGDGFHEVHHRDRGRNGSQGEYRGRGHRGFRGSRGGEGGYRGNRNGDGGYRGDRAEGGYQGNRGGDGGYTGGEGGYQGNRGGEGGYQGHRGGEGGYQGNRGGDGSYQGNRGGDGSYQGNRGGDGGYQGNRGGDGGYQGNRGGDGGYRGDRGEGGGYRPRGNYRGDRGDRGGEGYRGRGRGGGGGYRGGHRGRGGEPGS